MSAVEIAEILERAKLDLIFVHRHGGIAERIVDEHLHAKGLELLRDVGYAAVAQVGYVLLECDAEDADPGLFYRQHLLGEELDRFLRDKLRPSRR